MTVEVDAPRSQDLGKVLAELRAQYDSLAQKNLEDLEKQWGQQVGNSKNPKSHPQTAPEMVLGELRMQDNALVLKSPEDLEKQREWELGTPNLPQSTPKDSKQGPKQGGNTFWGVSTGWHGRSQRNPTKERERGGRPRGVLG